MLGIRINVILTVITLPCIIQLFAAAGPDPNVFPECTSRLSKQTREQRLERRGAVQAVQALSSQIALASLSPTANRTYIQELGAMLSGNQSRLGDADVAVRCLAHRRIASAYNGRPTFSILLEYFKRQALSHYNSQ